MSLLDTVEPDGYRMFDGEGSYDFREELPDQVSIGWSLRYGRLWEPVYSRETVESLLYQGRKEALLEAEAAHDHEDVLAPVGNSAYGEAYQDGWIAGAAAYRDELRRMAESDKTTMEGEKE